MLVNRWRAKGWFLSILLSGEGSWENFVFCFLFFFFPTNNNASIIHPKLWMWSKSKHFKYSCLSRFKIKIFWFANSVNFVILRTYTIFWFANSVNFVILRTYTINYTDTCRQYSPASGWLVFQNIAYCLFSAPHKPWIAVLRVIRQKDLECNPGQVK